MRLHTSSALIAKAPAGRHYCQLHRNPDTLAEAVALFVGTGLRRGDGVVLLAEPESIERFWSQLARVDIDPEPYRGTGQLVVADADTVLRQIMSGDMPDWPEFQRVVGGLLQRVRDPQRSTVRAYGELVNVLWHRGNPDAAITLEEFWNELARLHPFSLFCGYVLDGLSAESYAGPVHDIGRTHTDVLPTDDDERLQAAVDAASEDVLGLSLSLPLTFSGREQMAGEHRLPIGRRTMLWLQRNMPGSGSQILERARHYYRQSSGEALTG
jgi:hypothetical protein